MTVRRRIRLGQVRFHVPGVSRMADYGVDVLTVEFTWVFDSETGECLGSLQCVQSLLWRIGVWTPEGLRDGPTFAHRGDAIHYLKSRAKHRQEDTLCTSTSEDPSSATSPETPS